MVATLLIFQLSLARTRTFDPDEFQHAHSAFLISQGQLPYLDYFEHHPPLLHFVMAPIMARLHPERNEANAFETLFVLRVLGWSIALLGAIAHFLLARRLLGTLGASLASLFLWSTLIVFEKSMEIRPDTGAFALLQIALLLLVPQASRGRLLGAFSLLGVALLLTQKVAFPILGVMVAVWWLRRSREQGKKSEVATMLAGLLWPTVLCAAYFLFRGGLSAFLEDAFLINLRWKARLAPWPFLVSRFLEPNPVFAVMGILGLAHAALTAPSEDETGKWLGTMVLFTTVAGVVGLVALPVAWDQYYLLFLPPLSILGSGALLGATAFLLRAPAFSARVAVAVAAVALASLTTVKPDILNQRLRTSDAKKRAIGVILDNASPGDTVLDGYSGIGVFSPHAFRYFFLHAEMRLMLDERTVKELEEGLKSGVISPRFASGDSHLRAVSRGVSDFLDRNFEPVGEGPLEISVFPGGTPGWDDGVTRFPGQLPPPRGAYVLSLDGWSERKSDGRRTFRRSRGKASTLLFPVLDPGAAESLLLSARAGADLPGLSATLRLNGKGIGDLPLGPAFAEFELKVEGGLLLRGLNRLEFSYPQRPARIDPVLAPEDNAALALESLTVKTIEKEKGRDRVSPPGVRP